MIKFILSVFLYSICCSTMAQKNDTNFLEKLLIENDSVATILKQKDFYKIKIIYTQIDRDKNNFPSFTTYHYNINNEEYFYPASIVKMPIAFLALQRLNEMGDKEINKNTTMLTDSVSQSQTRVKKDTSSLTEKPSIANYIKKIFLVSDNDAYNRLYEFLGQAYINKSLHKMGYDNTEIRHRLGVSITEAQNKITNPIIFEDKNENAILNIPERISAFTFSKRNVKLGKGYYKNDILINEPFDFSEKNKIDLGDIHQILLSVVFPEAFVASKKFKLSKSDYNFLYKCMSSYPSESKFPNYDTTEYYDTYCKFLLYGSEKIKPTKQIRIFNKVGDAYGFLTDVAYIINFEHNIEFAVSASIYVNADQIFNDDKYEYETIGLPFMKNIGKIIYDYELKRQREYKPDLSKFKMKYDK